MNTTMSTAPCHLDSIPHFQGPPTPHGTQATIRWTQLVVGLLIHPENWRKLGFAVQWSKWLEWEGGLDLKSARSPGIEYLQNPLSPFALNKLLNQLDFSMVAVDTLVGCLEAGDWTALLKPTVVETATDPKVIEQATRSVEDLCLLSFYLRSSGIMPLTTPQEQQEDVMIKEAIGRILSNKNNESQRYPTWFQVFSQQNLRITSLQDSLNTSLPSKSSVLLNELLEVIRFRKLAAEGWTLMNANDTFTDAEFEKLGKLLSTSFFTISEFHNTSLYLPVENLKFLSNFAGRLPPSWYSDDFIRILLNLGHRFLATEVKDKVRVPTQVEGIVAISNLFTWWMRKTGGGGSAEQEVNVLGQEMIEFLAQVSLTPSLFIGAESVGLLSLCITGLAAGQEKWSGLMESRIVDGIVSALERGRRVRVLDSEIEPIHTSLAFLLKSPTFSAQGVEKVTKAFVGSFYDYNRSIPVQESVQVLRLFQFVVMNRAGLTEEAKKEKKRATEASLPPPSTWSFLKFSWKNKNTEAVNLQEEAWWQGMLAGLQQAADDSGSTREQNTVLLALGGILRAIQHANPDDNDANAVAAAAIVDKESLSLVQDVFMGQLKLVLDRLLQSQDSVINLSDSQKVCLAFICSQTIANLPSCRLDSAQRRCLLDLMLQVFVESTSFQTGIFPMSELFRTIALELSSSRKNQLTSLATLDGSAGKHPNTGKALSALEATVKNPVFTDMNRYSRTMAQLIEGLDAADGTNWRFLVQETVLPKLHARAVALHVDWAHCGLSNVEEQEVEKPNSVSAGTLEGSKLVWQCFKTLLFAYTIIIGALVEKSSTSSSLTNSRGDVVMVNPETIAQMDHTILDTFSYLYFISSIFGSAGFSSYNDLMAVVIERVMVGGSTGMGHGALKLNQLLKTMKPRADWTKGQIVMETRTVYYFDLLEIFMASPAIDNEWLENEILDLVYPYLIEKDRHGQLFEAAHSVIMSIFRSKKPIAVQVAPFYANLLLAHYPGLTNIDQLRAAFKAMTKALSESIPAEEDEEKEKVLQNLDEKAGEDGEEGDSGRRRKGHHKNYQGDADALAWLCVEKLLVKIQEHDSYWKREQREGTAVTGTSVDQPTAMTTTTTTITTNPATALAAEKERGELLLALFDQFGSLNLIFVKTLADKVKELVKQETSPQVQRSLMKSLLEVISGPEVDHTKRDWAVKWYLDLRHELKL